MLNVRLVGDKKFKKELERGARRIIPETEKRLRRVSAFVVGDAQKQFKGSRTRALYKISGGRRVKRKKPRAVTSPANKLGIFTGQYRKSISFAIERKRRKLRSVIGPVGIIYAAVHEFGTHGQKKRQVLTPAVKMNEQRITRELGKVWRTVIRR